MIETKIDTKEKAKEFPLLLTTDSEFIILATDVTEEGYSGFVLTGNGTWKTGAHRTNWDRDKFRLFADSLTLKNNVS